MCATGCGKVASQPQDDIVVFKSVGFHDNEVAEFNANHIGKENPIPIIFPGETTPRKLRVVGIAPTGHIRNEDGSVTILGNIEFSTKLNKLENENFSFIQRKLVYG